MAVNVFAFAGSLREGSFNKAALRAAVKLRPKDMNIEVFDSVELGQFPLYNEDVRQKGFPPVVETFREKIRAADAVLIATPEYNYSMSSVTKTAIDWASRPPDQPFAGKPIAIMGASPGMFGTARAQYHLRQSFVFLDGLVMNRPEVMIPQAQNKFEKGELVDEDTKKFIADMLTALMVWVGRVSAKK